MKPIHICQCIAITTIFFSLIFIASYSRVFTEKPTSLEFQTFHQKSHTEGNTSGICESLDSFYNSTEFSGIRCLVPLPNGSNCRKINISENKFSRLSKQGNILRLSGGYGRTANQLASVRNTLIVGAACGKVVILHPKVRGLGNAYFNCVDFTGSMNSEYWIEPNKSDCPSGDFQERVAYRIEPKLFQKTILGMEMIDRLVLAYLGVRVGWFRGDTCSLPSNVAVIYLRSGDIFEDNPHQSYGQPPLEYYNLVMDNLQKHVSVFLVLSQDERNPIYGKLIEKISPKYSVLGSTSFKYYDTLEWMFCAKFIVAAKSTLTPWLALSPNVEKVFVPEVQRHWSTSSLFIYQTPDNYSVTNFWRKTNEQLEEMVNYTGGTLSADINE